MDVYIPCVCVLCICVLYSLLLSGRLISTFLFTRTHRFPPKRHKRGVLGIIKEAYGKYRVYVHYLHVLFSLLCVRSGRSPACCYIHVFPHAYLIHRFSPKRHKRGMIGIFKEAYGKCRSSDAIKKICINPTI